MIGYVIFTCHIFSQQIHGFPCSTGAVQQLWKCNYKWVPMQSNDHHYKIWVFSTRPTWIRFNAIRIGTKSIFPENLFEHVIYKISAIVLTRECIKTINLFNRPCTGVKWVCVPDLSSYIVFFFSNFRFHVPHVPHVWSVCEANTSTGGWSELRPECGRRCRLFRYNHKRYD